MDFEDVIFKPISIFFLPFQMVMIMLLEGRKQEDGVVHVHCVMGQFDRENEGGMSVKCSC